MTLNVEKSTFLQARYPEPGRTFRSSRAGGLVLVDGQVLEDVTVPIFHGCAILGRVLDVNGDPVEFAQINVLRVPAPDAAAVRPSVADPNPTISASFESAGSSRAPTSSR